MRAADLPKGHLTAVLTSRSTVRCAVCSIVIQPGQPLLLDAVGWVHPACSREAS